MTPPNPTPAPTLGAGRYVIERKLGEGGHAAVYRVFDTRLGLKRAVKILLSEAARRAKLRQRFETEARTMAALDHPHVVRVYDVVTDAPLPFMVMELLTGGTLARWLELHGAMPPRRACACVREAALGAAAAHARGVVHRDIKPHNVLVAANGVCKLTDFGIARVGEAGHTRAGAAMGTQGYMAPEQAKDASTVDARVDVFSLGMTLFVLLTATDPLERLAGRGLDRVPPALRALVERATAFDRARRPPDVEALIAALDEATAALPPDPPAPPLPLPESDGDAIDWDELSTLDDPRKTTDAASIPPPTPRVLPYVVPTPATEKSDRTPDWVERAAEPARPRLTEVALDEASREATDKARRARAGDPSPTPAPAEEAANPEMAGAAEEATGFAREVATILIDLVLDPRKVAGPVLFLLVFFVGLPMLQTRDLRQAAREAREAKEALVALAEGERPGHDAVLALGGDPATLETLYAAWVDAGTEPEKTLALRRYVEALDNEVRARGIPGDPTTDRARAGIAELRGALVEWERKLAAYEAQRDSWSGSCAVGVSPP